MAGLATKWPQFSFVVFSLAVVTRSPAKWFSSARKWDPRRLFVTSPVRSMGCARTVLPGSRSSEHQATGTLPQSADNTGAAGHRLVKQKQKTGDGMLADEKPFC
jgi:hypothetical protein